MPPLGINAHTHIRMQASSDGQTGKKHNALGLVANGMSIVGIKTTHADVS